MIHALINLAMLILILGGAAAVISFLMSTAVSFSTRKVILTSKEEEERYKMTGVTMATASILLHVGFLSIIGLWLLSWLVK